MTRRQLLAGLLFVAGGYASYRWVTRNRFTVVNESGAVARDVVVGVGGELLQFGDLATDARASAHFRIGNEETFEMWFTLVDGTRVHEYVGYVVWEQDLFGVDVHLVIQPEGEVRFAYAH